MMGLQNFGEEGEEGADQDHAMDADHVDVLDEPVQPADRPRMTTRYMTKYERARILGTRALQIRCALRCSVT